MPEYLAPGVYIEETSFRAKSIEGVSTTTTGFVGPTRYGPINIEPDIITSLVEFERVYGDGQPLTLGSQITPNFMWHAVRAFFEEGGKRLYIARTFRAMAGDTGFASARVPTAVIAAAATAASTAAASTAAAAQADTTRLTAAATAAETAATAAETAATTAETAATTAETAATDAQAAADAAPGDAALATAAAAAATAATTARATATTARTDAGTTRANATSARTAATNAAANQTVAEAAATAAATAATNAANAAAAAAGTTAADPPETRFPNDAHIRARFQGKAGNLHVRFQLNIGQNILGGTTAAPTFGPMLPNDVVWVSHGAANAAPPPPFHSTPTGKLARSLYDPSTQKFSIANYGGGSEAVNPDQADEVRVVTLTVIVTLPDGTTQVWEGLAPEPGHTRAGAADSLTGKFAVNPTSLGQARSLPIVITTGNSITNGLGIIQKLFHAVSTITSNAAIIAVDSNRRTLSYETADYALTNGDDGDELTETEYTGQENLDGSKTGLKAFEDIEDISIVAAPGATFNYDTVGQAINNALLTHARNMRYRIAVLDSGNGQSIAEVRAMRAKFDSTYGAFYYPWVKVLDPITRAEIPLPPSGFVAGIYARNDINRAVWKAPANEVVNGAIGFELFLNKAQQDVLNPEGINCFRYFEGRGFRLWGARTTSSDPEWKYVNLRRYFCYLERSIDRGTQWAVFEPNGEALWANVRRTIDDFMYNEWNMGALLGDKPEKAYFVKCDRSTMTQNDLDNGRLVCLIGVAPLRPAEFVIFRIGQWTGDRKV